MNPMIQEGTLGLDYFKLNQESRSLDFSACRKTLRLAILSDSAPQYLTPLFKTLLCKHGIRAEVYEADYGTVALETLDPASKLYAFGPDVIVILNSVFSLRDKYNRFKKKAFFAEDQMSQCTSLWEALRKHTRAPVIQSNFVLPNERLFGNYEEKIAHSFFHATGAINAKMAELARGTSQIFMNDIDYVAGYYGRRVWLDEKLWILCKAFCAFEFLPYAVQNVVDTLLSLNGAGVKCVVLDLDNTLWGGLIGDDGLEGIRLGHFQDGEAFVNFQHFLRALKDRGILLAVCSKNDPEKAWLPFKKHPEMVLKEADITAFVANWVSKAENLKTLRETLNISYSAMVFVDDNPFERKLVRDELPEVIVPELPEDPAEYVRCLTELNLFESTAYSELDAGRTELYRVDAQRKLSEKQFANPEDYLKSLEMTMSCKRFDPFYLGRIAQLLQRSNQFNVLTKRYTEAQCEAFMRDEKNYFPIYLILRDKYGDHGLISAVIASVVSGTMRIEEWVMSCRVLARGVEQYTMSAVFEEARTRGVEIVKARYEATEKNGMVKDFFGRFGFRKCSETSDGAIDWEMDTRSYEAQPHWIVSATEEAGVP